MASRKVKQIFEHYCEFINSDEAAAILTLAEILNGSDSEIEPDESETEEQLTGG